MKGHVRKVLSRRASATVHASVTDPCEDRDDRKLMGTES
jgi:hypothetical protein